MPSLKFSIFILGTDVVVEVLGLVVGHRFTPMALVIRHAVLEVLGLRLSFQIYPNCTNTDLPKQVAEKQIADER
jgi:hypothetical protein